MSEPTRPDPRFPLAVEPLRSCRGDLAVLKARLLQARATLVAASPFLGSLMLKLPLVITEDPRMDTACVDGRGVCRFDQAFLAGLALPELRAILLHETLHLALEAFLRRGPRRPLRWNVAHDFAVNQLIAESAFPPAFLALPKACQPLLDARFRGLAAEEIYDQLPTDLRELGLAERDCLRDRLEALGPEARATVGQSRRLSRRFPCPDAGPAGDLWFASWEAQDAAGQMAVQEAWRDNLLEAAEQALQGEGREGLPGWAQKLLGPLLVPRIPWQVLLARKVRGHLKGPRRSFARPGRRSQSVGAVLPGPVRDQGRVGVFLDVSGSIGPAELGAFVGELAGLLQEAGLPVRLITWDTSVQEDRLLDRAEDLLAALQHGQLALRGGGGTDPRCVIARLRDDAAGDAPVSFGILLTDGLVPWPEASAWPVELLVVCSDALPDPACQYDAIRLDLGAPRG